MYFTRSLLFCVVPAPAPPRLRLARGRLVLCEGDPSVIAYLVYVPILRSLAPRRAQVPWKSTFQRRMDYLQSTSLFLTYSHLPIGCALPTKPPLPVRLTFTYTPSRLTYLACTIFAQSGFFSVIKKAIHFSCLTIP